MSELDDRLNEGRQTVAAMGPPEDLWAQVIERSTNGDAVILGLVLAPRHRRASLWLAVAAATVLLALVGALALLDDDQTVDITPVTEAPVVPEPPSNDDRPTTIAWGEDVGIGGFGGSGLAGQVLNIDVEEQNGEVTGEFRIANVVVTLQCMDTRTLSGSDFDRRDLILGGEVTANPDGLATLDAVQVTDDPDGLATHAVNVAVGDRLALIIREDDDRPGSPRVTLYHPSLWYGDEASEHAGSCDELVASVPGALDGGFFDDVNDGDDLETVPFSPILARGENVGIVDHGMSGGLVGHTLDIDAERVHGVVTGEVRVDNVVVTLQCADTDTIGGEIRLGGEVTDDPDGQGFPVIDGRVALGDRVALIIREYGPDFDMVTFFANESAGSCTELVDSFPDYHDGGFFNDVEGGEAIETSSELFNPGGF